MNIVITGAAGFLGYHLARAHVAQADQVVLLDNLSKLGGQCDEAYAQLLQHPAVTAREIDLTDPLANLDLPSDIDIVYHLAAVNGTALFYARPYHVARTNLLATLNLLDGLMRSRRRVGRLFYSSSSEVYAGAQQLGYLSIPTDERVPAVFPQPTPVRFSYGTSKFMGEVLCREFGRQAGIPCTVVRYHNVYGPRMGSRHVIPELIDRIRQGTNPLDLYGSHETRAFCYVDDAIRASMLVATTPACADQIIHIGTPHETVIRDLARLLMTLMGHEVPIREQASRADSVSRRCPDISQLRALTGFVPTVELRDGLERTIEWYVAHV